MEVIQKRINELVEHTDSMRGQAGILGLLQLISLLAALDVMLYLGSIGLVGAFFIALIVYGIETVRSDIQSRTSSMLIQKAMLIVKRDYPDQPAKGVRHG